MQAVNRVNVNVLIERMLAPRVVRQEATVHVTRHVPVRHVVREAPHVIRREVRPMPAPDVDIERVVAQYVPGPVTVLPPDVDVDVQYDPTTTYVDSPPVRVDFSLPATTVSSRTMSAIVGLSG